MRETDRSTVALLRPAFEVAGKQIANGERPFVIAEAGSNFDQSLNMAYRLIDAAAEAGADAVKFQLFCPESLYPPESSEHEAVKAVMLDPDWVPRLAEHASARGIPFMASAFDTASVDVLEAVGVPAHKVASSEATNLPLIAHMAATGRPIFLSTGMCDMVDVHEAVATCLGNGNSAMALMQCAAVYPLPPEQANLRVMDVFRQTFGCPAGFSDHTLGLAAPVAAAARGAAVIEKHFTLDRTAEGPDHFYALEPDELKRLVQMVREAHAALGDSNKQMLPIEREFGRREGLYAACDIAAGDIIDDGALAVRRPAMGLRARYRPHVVGARARVDIATGEPIGWNHIELS